MSATVPSVAVVVTVLMSPCSSSRLSPLQFLSLGLLVRLVARPPVAGLGFHRHQRDQQEEEREYVAHVFSLSWLGALQHGLLSGNPRSLCSHPVRKVD